MLVVYLTILLFFKKAAGSPGIQVLLRNVAVLEGQNVSMSCKPRSSNSSISWYYASARAKSSTETIKPINIGTNLTRNFTEFSFGSITSEVLQLSDSRLRHAGQYRCVTEGREYTAQLIVLASKPNCSYYTANGSQLHFLCSVMFTGNWAASMRWLEMKANGTKYNRAIIESNCSSSTAQNLELPIDFMSVKSESVFIFKMNFSSKLCDKAKTSANNTPSYEFTWKISIEQICYELFNVTVHPLKNSYTNEDNLACSYTYAPDSHFKWTEETTEGVIVDSIVSLKNFQDRHEPYVFRCLAFDPRNNLVGCSASITVRISTDEESNKHSLYSFIVPASVASVLFIMVASIAIIRKSKLTRNASRQKSNLDSIVQEDLYQELKLHKSPTTTSAQKRAYEELRINDYENVPSHIEEEGTSAGEARHLEVLPEHIQAHI